MKTDKDLMEKDKVRGASLITLLPILSLIAIILLGLVNDASVLEIAKIGTLTLILTAASVFFIRLQEEDILKKKYAKTIIIFSYLVSILLIMLPIHPELYSFWMIGGLLVAMLVDSKLGLLICFNLTFILSITLSLRPETTIQFLIMGVLMSLLAGALKNKSTVVYGAIILLSTNITLAFVINNFIFEASSNYNYLSSFFSIFAVLVTAFLISLLYGWIAESRIAESTDKDNAITVSGQAIESIEDQNSSIQASDAQKSSELLAESDGNVTDAAAELVITSIPEAEAPWKQEEQEDPVPSPYLRGTSTSYELLLSDQNGLLMRLKEYSESVYRHSLFIGEVSGRAAELIGADVLLARAGGMYHEIGKINGNDYISEGQKIAEEYAFPRELKAILKQHNIKHEKPSSVEAAIVMMTDTVVSTIDYIRKTDDKKYTVDKIIDNIFQMRMDKGTFDESGLSVKDYKLLKEFYLKEFR
jgi:hypothetical protein